MDRIPKGHDLWRGLVRVTPETFWMRETTTEGRFAEKNSRPAVFPDWHRARAQFVCGSIFVRHHHGDGGLRVVHVGCTASGNQLYKPGCAGVLAAIKRNG